MVTKTEDKVVERKKQSRRPFGVPTSRLAVDEIEGFHLRWINDEPGRIPLAQQSEYSFVEPSEVGREGTDDNRVKELVGVQRDGKTPMYAYLMKIPLEWYLEDKKVRDSAQDKFDDAIRRGQLERSPNQYVPDGGITYKTK